MSLYGTPQYFHDNTLVCILTVRLQSICMYIQL